MVGNISQSKSTLGHIFDITFLAGIAFKGIDGLIELLVGIPLLILSPTGIASVVNRLTTEELLEDPHDLIANLLIHHTNHLSEHVLIIGGVYLIVHGLVKLAIVIALIRGATKVYPWAIAALSLLTIYQIIEFILHPSIGLAALTAIDAIIIALTWREWRQGHSLRNTLADTMRWIWSKR